jgi:hypothetical protein
MFHIYKQGAANMIYLHSLHISLILFNVKPCLSVLVHIWSWAKLTATTSIPLFCKSTSF